MFCKNCGRKFENGYFCPACGTDNTPANRMSQTDSSDSIAVEGNSSDVGYYGDYSNIVGHDSVKKKQQKWFLLASLIGLVLILAGVTIAVIIMLMPSKGSSSAEDAINAVYSAATDKDAGVVLDCIPDDILEGVENKYRVDRSVIEKYINRKINKLDDISDLSLKIESAEKFSRADRIDFIEEIEDVWGHYSDSYDNKKFGEMAEYEVNIRCRRNGEPDQDTYDIDAYMYDGKWYCLDAIEILDDAIDDMVN